MAGFKREVAMLALPVLTVLGVVLAHVLHANAQTSSILEAGFVAAGTALAAALAVPRHMTIIGGSVITLLTLLSHYWWHIDPATLAVLLIAVQTIFGMQVRGQATPIPVLGPAPASVVPPVA